MKNSELMLTAGPGAFIYKTALLVSGGANDTAIFPEEVEATTHWHNTRAELFSHMATP